MSVRPARTADSSSPSDTGLVLEDACRARSTKSIIDRYGATGETVRLRQRRPGRRMAQRCSSAVA